MIRHPMFTLSLVVAACLSCGNVRAGDGDLDPRFGPNGDGRLTIGIDTGAEDIAVQAVPALDGSIYVVGRTSPGIGIVRLTADGLPDPQFAPVSYPPGAPAYWLGASAAVQAANGDLIVAGHYFGLPQLDGPYWIACRFDADGAPVDGFGDGEIAPGCTDKFGAGVRKEGEIRDLLIHPAGRIVFAGHIVDGADKRRAALSSLTPDGVPDPTFDDGVGEVNLVLPHGNVVPESEYNALALGPNGTLLGAGEYIISSDDSDVLVTMHFQNGTAFQQFGANGSAIHALNLGPAGARHDAAFGIEAMAGGVFGVVGSAQFSLAGHTGGFVLWIKPNGSLETSLGNNGRTVLQEDGMDFRLYDIERTPKGRSVIGGSLTPVDAPDVMLAAVVRLDAAGDVDTTFKLGLAAFPFSDAVQDDSGEIPINPSEVLDLTMQGDRILAVGYQVFPLDGSDSDFGVARIGDGRLFGDGLESFGP